MEEWQKTHIKANLMGLLESTECTNKLLVRLKMNDILGPADISTISSIQDPFSKTLRFYEIVETRKNAYMVLLEALEAESHQTDALEILRKGIPPFQAPVKDGSPAIQFARPHVDDTAAPTNLPPPTTLDEVDFVNNMKPLQVSVTRPMGRMSFPDDQYRLPHHKKGFALILNITEFQNSSRNRAGAKLDTQYMCELWTQLGYKITCHEGFFTFRDVDRILEEFKAQFTTLPMSAPISCVIFIGSHGAFSKIESSDHRDINLYKHVIYKFDSQNCPQLDGKPKIFLIQACQRFQHDDAGPPTNRTDADSILQTPIDDAIVSFSTIPGYVANRDLYLGTWYTYCLSKVIMEEAHRMDFLRMLKKTQDLMRKINADGPQTGQLSTYLDLGIKTMYFNMDPN